MQLDEPGIPAHAFAQLLESDAFDAPSIARFRAILKREGVDADALERIGAQAPLRWFRDASPGLDADQAARLGHVCGQQARLTSYGPLSLPLISAGSVAEIFELLAFLPLITTAISAHLHTTGEGLVVVLIGQTGDPDLDSLAVHYSGSALMRLIHLHVGELPSVSLHINRPVPSSLADHEDIRMGNLVFDAPMSFVHVPTATLEAVCRFSDRIAYQHAIADLRQSLDHRIRNKSFSGQVRRLLNEGPGLQRIQNVANELMISTSTLKRRLADEGTTFRELLEVSLYERATLRLLDPAVTVSETATDLGYSDLTNFSHAFKRWTGQSPGRFRREHQGS
ncbi:AraC family transcriptional regulator [Aeromicrobium sp. A1-2]|nr:AraC family transcriptional regulator [Aeromicrobium sp. A1-2]